MRAVAIFFLVFLGTSPAWAFRFSPMVATLSASGPDATQTFMVENNNGEKIALQIEAFHRDVDADGKETRRETDEFSIFPEQMVLEPGEKRNIRLTWTGERQPKEELPYRLVVSQLPVDLKKPEKRRTGANITFLLQYVASVYVSPGVGAPRISVESFKILPDKKAELVLKNSGSAHRVLKGIRLLAAGKPLSGFNLKDLDSENVLPGKSRRFQLELLKGAALPSITAHQKVEVEFDSQ
jgi:fimbrial chaperone protein